MRPVHPGRLHKRGDVIGEQFGAVAASGLGQAGAARSTVKQVKLFA